MKVNTIAPPDIDTYIAGFPKETQKLLQQVRTTIKKAAPKTQEVISYGMPGFKQHKVVVYFAGYKNHIGFYPTPSGVENFKNELTGYVTSKGAIQFPIDQPMPLPLISKITAFRLKEDEEKAVLKAGIKKK